MDIWKQIEEGKEFNINETEGVFARMLAVQDKCAEYNALKPSDMEKRNILLKNILGKTGEIIWIAAPFYCGMGKFIEVGENFFASHNTMILDLNKVKFGNDVWIGPNCGFYTSGHSVEPENRKSGGGYAFPITVGNNVWFGGNVIVVPSKKEGITIGDNSLIAAGTVITKDVPANVVMAGNPARIVKELNK